MSLASWEWSAEARRLISFVYEFWVERRRPPAMVDIFDGTGLDSRSTRRLARELQEGFALAFDDNRVTFSIDKAPPFSATPTSVVCELEGEFLTYVGCPMEVTTIGYLPPLEDRPLTIRSHCACCFEPFSLEFRGRQLLSDPGSLVIAVIRSPWDVEHGVTAEIVCDSYHFALDRDHAARFEAQVARRAVLLTFSQAQAMTRLSGEQRMRDPHWKATRIDGQQLMKHYENNGVDVSPWRQPEPIPVSTTPR